ncbi:laccase domain-containing protein [Candidatus Gottesmanbacteria bacterium]|nr:laccase domain-containing protein [Candidatus Gottesmanbacteria bacterium]
MLKKQPDGLVVSTLLPVPHCYTTRALGDMKKSEKNRERMVRRVFGTVNLVIAEQVHGSEVAIVDGTKGYIPSVDALVARIRPGSKVTLGVFVADCVPMLLVDPNSAIIATVHAGWKGTLGAVTKNAVETMRKLGGSMSDIRVSIGPHIGMCHYDVPKERAQKFLNAFGNDPKVASYFERGWHVDIGWANYRQLIDC